MAMAPPLREEPTALERALRLALSSADASDTLAAVCADGALLRDAQSLFAQLLAPARSSGRDAPEPPLVALVALVAAAVGREKSDRASRKRKRRAAGGAAEDDSDANDDDAPPVPWDVVALLAAARVSLGAFLRQFSRLFERLVLGPELLEVATQLKEEFTVATVLFEKFRALWRKLVAPVASGHVHEPILAAPPHRPTPLEDNREPEPEETQQPRRRKMSDMLLYQLASVDRHQQLHDAGWLLFLVARRRLAGQYAGLGQLYYLLLAVLHLVLSAESPLSLEAEVAAALSALGGTAATAPVHEPILAALCANPKVEHHEVTRAIADVDALLRQLQAEALLVVPAAAPASGGGSAQATTATRSLASAVLSDDAVADNVSQLSAYYKQTYVDSCGKLDERLYLDAATHEVIMGPKPPQPPPPGATSALSSPVPAKRPARADRPVPLNPFASPSRQPATPQRRGSGSTVLATPGPPPSPFTGQAWQWHGSSPPPSSALAERARALHTPNTRAFLHTATSHQASPFVSQTPVTAAVETSNWVRDTLAHSGGGFVSPHLKLFFRDCATDPTDHIARVLQELSARLVTARRRASGPPATPALDENDSAGTATTASSPHVNEYSSVDGSLQKTKNLAIALFYRVLEALLLSERERLRTTNFSSLLHNESFVASLFACSLEVVLKAHSLITLSFPFLLDAIRVNAFDFGKIVESFVKHAPRLPNALKRHMRDLEQTILDSLAWRADSGLYVVLAGDTRAAPPESALLASLTNGTPSVGGTIATPSSAATRTSVLQLFFRKVLSLAASRIFRLGTLLELDAKYLNQVWTAVKECISSHHALLKDRHLDQVILCSLYGVCKVNNVRPEVTFKRVIDAYKKLHSQPAGTSSLHGGSATPVSLARGSSNDVIRNIKLDADDARGDIIKFYNRCYIPTMKVFMLQFQVQDKQMAAAAAAAATATGGTGAGGASQAPPGFTPRREGSVVAASTSDTEIVAEAAADAVEKVMKSYGIAAVAGVPGLGTPQQRAGLRRTASPRVPSSPVSSLQLFTSAEVQSLPVSVHHTSPKRVLSSNLYMSPLQQARLHQQRSHLTPRSHALYAFGESPARDLALINRAVNTTLSRARVAVPLVLTESHDDDGDDDDDMETSESNSNSAASTPTNSTKRRRLGGL
ncbi:hypothetical protein PybrP1_001081 [[Pythium] brassicae (nom. inval.)]|nr:hypothetical protein PybrP1_001081 [[Pythium] brassicae (nom. inval.)]